MHTHTPVSRCLCNINYTSYFHLSLFKTHPDGIKKNVAALRSARALHYSPGWAKVIEKPQFQPAGHQEATDGLVIKK